MNKLEYINNKDEFEQILSLTRKRSSMTNISPTLKQYYQLIKQQKLFYFRQNLSVMFFEKNDECYKCTFVLNGDEIYIPTLDKPVISSVITRKTSNNDKIINIMKTIGFQEYMKHEKWKVTNDKIKHQSSNDNIQCEFAKEVLVKDIYHALQITFDTYTEPIPSQQELYELISKNQIITAMSDLGVLMGTLVFSVKDGISNLEHIVTLEGYRNRGIAKTMCNLWLNSLSNDCNLFTLWVRENNISAKKLYESFGFVDDGRISIELLLKK